MTCTILSPLRKQEASCEAKMDRFDTLVESLKDILGPSSGITSDDVDVEDLMHAMEQYTSDDREWTPYAMADPSRAYTRNLVDEGNGNSNLVRNESTNHRLMAQQVINPVLTER